MLCLQEVARLKEELVRAREEQAADNSRFERELFFLRAKLEREEAAKAEEARQQAAADAEAARLQVEADPTLTLNLIGSRRKQT